MVKKSTNDPLVRWGSKQVRVDIQFAFQNYLRSEWVKIAYTGTTDFEIPLS